MTGSDDQAMFVCGLALALATQKGRNMPCFSQSISRANIPENIGMENGDIVDALPGFNDTVEEVD